MVFHSSRPFSSLTEKVSVGPGTMIVMSTGVHDTSHPVVAFVAGLGSALDGVAGTPAWSMGSADLADALVGLHREQARLVELELRLVRQATADGLGSEVGAADTTAWWANSTLQTRRDAHRRLALARALDDRAVLRDALRVGDLGEDQAGVIVRALESLPEDVDADVVELAEKELVRLAGFHDATDLTRLGKRILDVVAPEVGEAQLATTLEREEQEAAQACRLTMRDDGHGQCRGTFVLPSAEAAIWRKHLNALIAPKHQASLGAPEDDPTASAESDEQAQRLSLPRRLGQAFCDYIRRYPVDRTPHAGGVSAQVVVTMTIDDFTAATDHPAMFDTGQQVIAAQARMTACEAGIVPVVLDGKAQPLDVGRAKRFHTPAQRIAIALRDRTCSAEACDWPPAMCHVHHDDPWSHGGPTNVEQGRLLCPRHHSMAHQKKYTMKATKNGRVIFSRT